jgi:ribosome-binding factor A
MSSHGPSRKEIASLCNEVGPEDGIDPRLYRPDLGRDIGRKTLQLAKQVSRTLSEVLASCADDLLRELEVVDVCAASGSGRLLVTLRALSANHDRAQIQTRLRAAQGMLRNEVVAAVHRRKAPELIFRLLEGE